MLSCNFCIFKCIAVVGNHTTTIYDLIDNKHPGRFEGKDKICKGGWKGKSKEKGQGKGGLHGDSACKLLHIFWSVYDVIRNVSPLNYLYVHPSASRKPIQDLTISNLEIYNWCENKSDSLASVDSGAGVGVGILKGIVVFLETYDCPGIPRCHARQN